MQNIELEDTVTGNINAMHYGKVVMGKLERKISLSNTVEKLKVGLRNILVQSNQPMSSASDFWGILTNTNPNIQDIF